MLQTKKEFIVKWALFSDKHSSENSLLFSYATAIAFGEKIPSLHGKYSSSLRSRMPAQHLMRLRPNGMTDQRLGSPAQ